MRYKSVEEIKEQWHRYNKRKEFPVTTANRFWQFYEKWNEFTEKEKVWIKGIFELNFSISDRLVFEVIFKGKGKNANIQGLRMTSVSELEREYGRLEEVVSNAKKYKKDYLKSLHYNFPEQTVKIEKGKVWIGDFKMKCDIGVVPLPSSWGGVHNVSLDIKQRKFSEYRYFYSSDAVEEAAKYTSEQYQSYLKNRMREVLA